MLLANSNSIIQLYPYGTNSHTIHVRLYHMRIRVWYVPYAYGMKYAYGTQHYQHYFVLHNKLYNKCLATYFIARFFEDTLLLLLSL